MENLSKLFLCLRNRDEGEREIVPILMMMRMIRDCTNIDDDEDDDRIDIGQEK